MFRVTTRPYYLLFEAFEALGQRLYGSEWTRNEFVAVGLETVEQAKAELARYQEIDERTTAQLDELSAESLRTTNAERIKAIESAKAGAQAERATIHSNYWMPGWREGRIASARTYERRETTETMLIDAIKANKFPVVARHGNTQRNLEPWLWQDKYFGYDLEISAVRVPSGWGKRFQSARIPEGPFEAWLSTVVPLTPAGESALSPEEQCERYFAGEVAKGPKQMSRDQYIAQARKLIPNLSYRAARRTWDSRVVPDEWKKHGAPSRKNRSAAEK